MNKKIFTFLSACIFVICCTACNTKKPETKPVQTTARESSGILVSAAKPTDMDVPEPEETASLPTHTYTTKLSEANGLPTPVFMFDYPDNWRVSAVDIGEESEFVDLTNDDGIVIEYMYVASSAFIGDIRDMVDVNITKIADSRFVPGYAQTMDYSHLGKFAVVKTEADSERYYAVMPESECSRSSVEANFTTGFWYDGCLEFKVAIPEKLTPQKEQEIVGILSSFRVSDSTSNAAAEKESPEGDPSCTALQNGDFSEFAGTYRPCSIYVDAYGGGGELLDLILYEDGRTADGGPSFDPSPYPQTRPVSVTKKEDGSYLCQVEYLNEDLQSYFLIYPTGMPEGDPCLKDNPSLAGTPCIRYVVLDGGVMDITYHKIEN